MRVLCHFQYILQNFSVRKLGVNVLAVVVIIFIIFFIMSGVGLSPLVLRPLLAYCTSLR
jgi:hypothetical protein